MKAPCVIVKVLNSRIVEITCCLFVLLNEVEPEKVVWHQLFSFLPDKIGRRQIIAGKPVNFTLKLSVDGGASCACEASFVKQ